MRPRGRFRVIVLTAVLAFFFCGCERVRYRVQRKDVRTGMFGNDLQRMQESFAKIERHRTTRRELEDSGFIFKTNNVQIIEGAHAIREIYGSEVFRNLEVFGGDNLDKHFDRFSRYTLIEIPFTLYTNKSHRLYISRKVTEVRGWDVMFFIMLRDDLVVYKAEKKILQDRVDSDRAFLKGITELFSDFGNPSLSINRAFVP